VGTLTSVTAATGTWTFTINALTMGGLVGDDSVYYYVVAQDSTGFNNLGSFPGGVEGTDVNTITVTPTPFSYKITPVLSGTILVGAGQTYTTLTATNGLFNYLNSAAIGGNLTVQITSDIEEPGTVGLNETVETGVGVYTINIVPDAAVLRNITGAVVSGALIRLNGADRVKVDGSFGGSGNYLRFMNRTLAGNTITLLNDADFDTLSNLIVEGVNNTVGLIYFWTPSAAGTGNDSNVVMNCLIRDTIGSTGINKPNTGLFSQSGNAFIGNDFNSVINCEIFNFRYNGINLETTAGNNWTIYGNKFYRTDTTTVESRVLYIKGGGNHTIRKNSIGGASTTRNGTPYFNSASTFYGVSVTSTSNLVSTIDSNEISNIMIGDNGSLYTIYGIQNSAGTLNINANIIGGGINVWDTISSGYQFHGISLSAGTNTVENNLISNAYYRYVSTGVKRTYGINITGGTNQVRFNSIHDLAQNALYTTSFITAGYSAIGIYYSASTGTSNLEGNTIYNIDGLSGYAACGIFTGSTAAVTVTRNRVYNITANGSIAAGSVAAGICAVSTGNNVFSNNQITVGANAKKRVFGIYDTKTSGTNQYVYNTIVINGEADMLINLGAIGIYSTAAGVANVRNNIIYNSRKYLGSVIGHAVASTNAILSVNLNYNLLVSSDTATVANLGGTPQGWATLDNLYNTSPNTNWATTSNMVTADSLFIDTLVGNLGIVTTNPQAWYANGKGIAMATISGDYTTASGARSTTIATGSTDIGSVEFTPASTPPLATQIGNIAANDSTSYFVASRLVGKINWGSAVSYPTDIEARYYSGVNPANASTNTTMNAYWDIQPIGGGTDYVTTLTLMQDSAVMGTVTTPSNLKVARYTGAGSIWDTTATTVNNLEGFMTTMPRIGTLGIYTATDVVTNSLPVTLTSFTALAKAKDANLNWSTATEINNKGFEVERSVDGKSFVKVAFVKGAGNSNVKMNYALTDAKAFVVANSNILYYRLKQVDLNGTATYSNIVKVSINAENVNSVLAYPNPFTTDYSVSFTAAKAGVANIVMVDMQGRKVVSLTTDIITGNNMIPVNTVATLEAGVYFVSVTVNGETQVIKLVKN
jgi:hypothetical protein